MTPPLKPILITGSHKSGKSFVAKGLSLSDKILTIYEPLNCNTRIGINGLKVNHWFKYINGDEEVYRKEFTDTMRFTYRYGRQLTNINSLKEITKIGRDIINVNRQRLLAPGRVPMIDDPFAVFSAEWFYKTFDMKVVVLVRHPASFISSLKLKKREHPFSHFSQQRKLMHDKLAPFREEIEEFAGSRKDVVEQGILLWRMINTSVNQYREKYAEKWCFLRFEDFVVDPMVQFEKVYKYLDIEYDTRVKQKIKNYIHSDKEVKPEIPAGRELEREYPGVIGGQLKYFRKILSPEEILIIKEKTRDTWPLFYSETDW